MSRTVQILDRVVFSCLIAFVVFSLFSISLTQIAFAVGALAWLARVHLTGSWRQVQLPLGIPILIFVLACVLAVITAVDPGNSVKSLKKLLQVIILFWAANSIRDAKQRDLLVLLLVISACVAAVYGFYQAWDRGVALNTRVEGTMSIYMTFAGLLMIVGLLALSRALFRRPAEKWMWGAVGVITLCLLLTLTRQAWLGFLTGSLFLIFVWKKKYLIAVPVLLVVIVLASPGAIKDRLHAMVDLEDGTFKSRVAMWKGGWAIFKDYPLTGCGFKCVDLIHTQYPDPGGYIKKLRGMHNNFVQLAVDTGVIGLGAWISIWVMYFLSVYRRMGSLDPEDSSKWVVAGSAGAVIGFHAGGLFEVNFYDSEVVMLLYFIMALPFTIPERAVQRQEV